MDEFNVTETFTEPDGDESSNLGTNNNEEDRSYTMLSPDRKYFIGRDRLKGSRIWINVPGSDDMFIVFVLNDQNDDGDFYKCINCMRYEKCRKYCSMIKVTRLEDGGIQIWESCDHYDSCGMPLAKIEDIQDRYHRAPGTPRMAKRSSDQSSSSRIRSRTDAVARKESKLPKPRQVINRSRTAAPQPTRTQPARARAAKRIIIEDEDDDEEEVPSAAQLSLPPSAKRGRSSCPAQMNMTADSEPSSESQISSVDVASSSVEEPQEQSHLRMNELLESLPDQRLRSISNYVSVAPVEVRTPKHVHFSTNLLSTQMLRQPNTAIGLRKCEPRILKDDESIFHCLPSTDELRRMCTVLMLGYFPENQLCWHSTYAVNQIHAHSKAATFREISSVRNTGFEALSLFFTNSEESSFSIQTPLKYYIGKKLVDEVGYDAILNDLVDFRLSRLHLWALTEMLEVRVIVFSDRGVEVYGNCFNNSLPSMILELKNNAYHPIMTIT